ncbi:hypothetical protein Anapl_12726 [Anas platyrhynchos]|uniref:Uncharacterized protein n=1 Tax=Anas platyrhynchos TaxID=8839 RepID=R0LI10_ANAPL|nr:hypothetical protein Anapl_12726 [Anas platyrhynchos]
MAAATPLPRPWAGLSAALGAAGPGSWCPPSQRGREMPEQSPHRLPCGPVLTGHRQPAAAAGSLPARADSRAGQGAGHKGLTAPSGQAGNRLSPIYSLGSPAEPKTHGFLLCKPLKGHQTSSVPAAGKGSVRAQTNLFPLPLRLQQYQVVKCLLSEGPSDLRNVTRSGARRLLPSARHEACPGDGAAAGRTNCCNITAKKLHDVLAGALYKEELREEAQQPNLAPDSSDETSLLPLARPHSPRVPPFHSGCLFGAPQDSRATAAPHSRTMPRLLCHPATQRGWNQAHGTASGQSLGSNGEGDALSEFRNAKQHTPAESYQKAMKFTSRLTRGTQPLRARAGDRLPRSICWRRVRLSQEKASRERSPRLRPAARCLTCSPARRGYRQRPRESDQEGKFKGSTRLSSRRGDARNSSGIDVRGGTGIHTSWNRSDTNLQPQHPEPLPVLPTHLRAPRTPVLTAAFQRTAILKSTNSSVQQNYPALKRLGCAQAPVPTVNRGATQAIAPHQAVYEQGACCTHAAYFGGLFSNPNTDNYQQAVISLPTPAFPQPWKEVWHAEHRVLVVPEARDTRTGSQRDDGISNARQLADSMWERLRHMVLGTIYGPLAPGPEHPGLSAAHGHQGPALRAGTALALPGCRTPPSCTAGPRAAPAPGSEELCSWLREVLAALHPWQARAAAGCRAAGQEGTQPPAQLTGRLACTLCCCNKRPPAASAGHGGPCSTGEQLVVLPGRAAKPSGLYKAPLAAEVTAHEASLTAPPPEMSAEQRALGSPAGSTALSQEAFLTAPPPEMSAAAQTEPAAGLRGATAGCTRATPNPEPAAGLRGGGSPGAAQLPALTAGRGSATFSHQLKVSLQHQQRQAWGSCAWGLCTGDTRQKLQGSMTTGYPKHSAEQHPVPEDRRCTKCQQPQSSAMPTRTRSSAGAGCISCTPAPRLLTRTGPPRTAAAELAAQQILQCQDLSYPSCCACRSGSTVPAVSRVSGASASFPPRGLACQLSSCTTASTTSAVVPLAGRGSVCLRLTRHREASSFQPPGCGQKEQKRSQGSHCAQTDGHGQPALKHQVPPHPAPCPPQQPAECHGSSKALPGQKAASSSHHIPLLTRPHRRQKPSVVSSEDKALLLLPVAVQEGAVDCDHFSLAGKDSTFGASGLFILLIWLIRIWAQSKRSQ